MIIGIVASLLLLVAIAVTVVCCVRIRRRTKKKAYASAKVPDADKMEINQYEDLQDIPRDTNEAFESHPKQKSPDVTPTDMSAAVLAFFKEKRLNKVQTNTPCKNSEVNVPDIEVLEENEYDEIRAVTMDHTADVTYYNTSVKHSTVPDNAILAKNHAGSKSKRKQGRASDKSAKPKPDKESDGKLEFVQVDGFRGKWSFFAFQCPKSKDSIGQFWSLLADQTIQNVVLLQNISSKVLPNASGSTFNGIRVFCEKNWQNKGIKKFTVTFSNEEFCEESEYANPHRGINVLSMDHKLTNKAIISLRQYFIPSGKSSKCAIMCKDGQQLSGLFIGVNCMLDKADEDSQFDVVYGLQKFKTVCPDFELSKKQLMQLDQLAKDYISYGEKSK
ncbi:hypothetical protein CAPTEDRAFT_190971 [Capitella teleta]|uniref:Tyrosine-protein phosphatase domain-containing protein n=1 Tax=Capitella teleta TaxID=283909 RepID=R7TRY4_CAPTE|nr:hypothetical protein CAPTEDRAFT_190971 [Capitella teleta]|eukprot:ELT93790.1 hypothetical protein CAPTEDRAFT_190971 [Capitella teleta]